ncbi:hypothetical protein niasHT_000895 [Heterodera trifolii]|uniref:Vacuolar protein sorting-associated protein 13 DH-like domain-containing protein n=1 Tax=Heterodera trifolii TaxID=157864 RepID=A0ABD2M7P7_9BILA
MCFSESPLIWNYHGNKQSNGNVQERFDQKQQPYVQEHSEPGPSPTDAVTHQLFASFSIPELLVQLGSQKAAQGYLMNPKIGHIEPSTSSTQSESDQSATSSFVRSSVRSLQISYSRIDSQRLSKWELDFDDVLIWLLEKGNRIKTTPFLRLNIRDLNVKSASSRVKAFLNLTIDYYRLRTLPGWEPLLEQCNKFGIDVDFTDSKQTNILLKPATGDTLEFTLTQLFIERALDFVAHSNSLQQIVFASDQADGLDRLRHLFHQQRQNAPGNIKVYDHHHPYETDLESVLTSDFDVQFELADGFAVSLVGIVDEEGESKGLKQEELCYGRLSGIKLNVGKFKATYRINCHIDSIQMDNQIIGADRWHFLFCDPGALKDEPMVGLPALAFEMSYTPSEFFDVYECFRLKLSNACILLDEQLLWRLVHFWRCVLKRWQDQSDHQQRENVTTPTDGTECGTESPSFLHNNCYFGTLQLEFGNISLSVLTVDKSALSLSIRQLKDSFSEQLTLFSFENALVTLAPFCWLRYFCSLSRLLETLGNFYLNELKRQKLNIIFAMDAFGNPMALGNELKEGLQGLIFEGDLAGFAFGIGYGAANSLSKVTSSMAQGVGSLTFDEKHEELRRQMRRAKPEQSGPLTHLYGGIKGLGVGVFGGLTAIVKNTVTATQENGLISGIARGVATGAIDTLTKPLQGTLDLLEGTASAVKEMVGAPLVRRAHFPDRRLRPSRVCSSLSGLLPAYSVEKAEAQLELMRITGTYALNDQNRLLAVVPFLVRTNFNGARVVQRALISLVQCCIVRQVDSQPSMVTYRVLFQHFDIVRLVPNENQQQNDKGGEAAAGGRNSTKTTATQQRLALIEFVSNSDDPQRHHSLSARASSSAHQQHQQHHHQQQRHQSLTLWCSDRETAKLLCKQIMRAKALFDRRATGGKVLQRNAKKLQPIFTI